MRVVMSRLRCLAIAASLALWIAPMEAHELPVDLELVIAIDASSSMDSDEQSVQRQGYISAFTDQELVAAIAAGRYRRVAIAVVEWSGPTSQRVIVPWTLIHNAESAAAFALALEAPWHITTHGTSISSALMFSTGLFAANAYAGDRQVIDISGDGRNNAGDPVDDMRDWVVRQGVTINGLPIVIKEHESDPGLTTYYRDCVIGGPGAFTVTVSEVSDFRAVIRRKLLREILARAGPAQEAAVAQGVNRPDCWAPSPHPWMHGP
jgi:hypothetical protein